jgi:NAD+ kinase
VSTVSFVVHEGRPAAVEAAASLRVRLEETGARCVDAQAPSADLVVAVGGDGTFLRGARVAVRFGAPVIGVKVGRLGFLTEVEPDEAAGLIAAALAGTVSIDARLAVVAEPLVGSAFEPQWGMNEIMIEKAESHRLVRLRVLVDDAYVTTLAADGVIVATPTGSTAYSFSAGGPIVSPSVDALILTPVAPHMVFDRSIVLDASQTVVLEVVGDEAGLLSTDGRAALELRVGSRVRVRAAEERARFVVRPGGPPFLARVRDKFDLPGDPQGP